MRESIFRKIAVPLTALLCFGCDGASNSDAPRYPTRPIKLVVPFGAGGGTDTFARILRKAIDEDQLLPAPLVVLNVPGAGATIGSRRVKDARPDGHTILLLHEAILTAKHYGQVGYGPEAFEPIASTGEVGLVVAVPEDSPYQTLRQVMEAARDTPDEILFAANMGAPSHFCGLMLEAANPGSRFRYVQHGGGPTRFAALLGGHADVSVFSIAEYLQFRDGGLRALADCAIERHPEIDVPTTVEQGYDVVSSNVYFWWAPRGTSRAKLDVVARVLEQAMRAPRVVDRLKELSIRPTFRTGEALEDDLADRERRIASVSQRPALPLPDFPLMAFSAVVFLGILVGIQSTWAGRGQPAAWSRAGRRPKGVVAAVVPRVTVIATAVLTVAYVASMQAGACGFRLATAAYVASVGVLLARGDKRIMLSALVLAALLSVGLHAVMTRVFVIDLP